MPQILKCPACGAPLDIDPNDLVIRCAYCDSPVIIPQSVNPQVTSPLPPSPTWPADDMANLRKIAGMIQAKRKLEAIKQYRNDFDVGLKEAKDAVDLLEQGQFVEVMQRLARQQSEADLSAIDLSSITVMSTPLTAPPARRSAGCARLLLLILAVAILFLVGLTISEPFRAQVVAWLNNPGQGLEQLATLSQPPALATELLSFGSEGTGPGQFTDARYVTVNRFGHVYVGEYTGGRIQVFDETGKFLKEWSINPEAPLQGLAADGQGVLYTVQNRQIFRFVGIFGQPIEPAVPYAEGLGFRDVFVTADDQLLTVWNSNIVRLSPDGRYVFNLIDPIRGITGSSEPQLRVTADQAGHIYGLGLTQATVFKFNPEGLYTGQFGRKGDSPGQFTAPQSIAVDRQGRIHVTEMLKGVHVFAADGQYLGLIEVEPPVFGLALNAQDELYVVAKTRVVKFVLGTPQKIQ